VKSTFQRPKELSFGAIRLAVLRDWKALRNALLMVKFTNGFRAERKISDKPLFKRMYIRNERKDSITEPRQECMLDAAGYSGDSDQEDHGSKPAPGK
jgi:hypothetical protein